MGSTRCKEEVGSEADWGVYPSTASAVPLPLGEGGFLGGEVNFFVGVDAYIDP